MYKHLLLLLLLITTKTIVFSQQANDYKLQGDTSFKNKHYAVARAYYTKVIDSNDWNRHDLADIYSKRAQCDNFLNDFKKAISDYTTALNNNPDLKEAYWNRASAYVNLNDYKQCIGDFKKAIAYYSPDDHFHLCLLYNNIAYAEFRVYEIDSALKYNSAAYSENPRIPIVYTTRGEISVYLKKYPEAIENFSHAIEYSDDLIHCSCRKLIISAEMLTS